MSGFWDGIDMVRVMESMLPVDLILRRARDNVKAMETLFDVVVRAQVRAHEAPVGRDAGEDLALAEWCVDEFLRPFLDDVIPALRDAIERKDAVGRD